MSAVAPDTGRHERHEPQLPHDATDLIRLCKAQGWKTDYTKGGQIRIWPPIGAPITFKFNQGSWKYTQNFRATLKRAGLKPITNLKSDIHSLTQGKQVAAIELKPAPLATLGDFQEEEKDMQPNGKDHDHEPTPAEAHRAMLDSYFKKNSGPSKRGDQTLMVLEAIEKTGRAGGCTAADIIAQVNAKLAKEKTTQQLSVQLANICTSGWITRVSAGRFVVSEQGKKLMRGEINARGGKLMPPAPAPEPEPPGPPPVQATIIAPVEAPITIIPQGLPELQPTDESTDVDCATLDECLHAIEVAFEKLQACEPIIRAHRRFAVKHAKMKRLIEAMKE